MRSKRSFLESEGDCSKRERTLLGVTLIAVMLGFLVIWLTSCSSVPETKTIRIEPPKRYIQPTGVPRPGGDTVRHIIEMYVPALQQSLKSCNADKRRVREWAAED